MRGAAIISFLVALVLIGVAYSDWHEGAQNAAHDMEESFRELNRGDTAALDQRLAEKREAERTQAIEAIGGVAFLIAGLALWSKRATAPQA
jgi:hypothetical protein